MYNCNFNNINNKVTISYFQQLPSPKFRPPNVNEVAVAILLMADLTKVSEGWKEKLMLRKYCGI